MRAEIISIGTEILLGEIQDTNARYLAQRLPGLGIDLYFMHQIGDNRARLGDLIRSAMERSELILCTGGLGPTEDDVTREAIAEALGETPTIVPELEQTLREFFSSRTLRMPERNLKQATLIPSAQAIPNPRGTAPGWWVEKSGTIIVAMPGPPGEMHSMWERDVRPRLAERSTGAVIISRTLKTVGIGEGTVDEMVSHLLKGTNPSIGVYAKEDGIHLRLTAKTARVEEAYRLIRPVEEEVRQIFGTAVWGADEETLAGAVGDLLKERRLSVAVMESCTGGLLASTLTDVPGSSEYFKGGIVAYTAEVKRQFGVPGDLLLEQGVVSEATARAMAAAVREALGADIGVGVTGVAGPEPHGGKPVGTIHVAINARSPSGAIEAPGASGHIGYEFRQSREAIKARAVTTALLLIRRAVLGELPG